MSQPRVDRLRGIRVSKVPLNPVSSYVAEPIYASRPRTGTFFYFLETAKRFVFPKVRTREGGQKETWGKRKENSNIICPKFISH